MPKVFDETGKVIESSSETVLNDLTKAPVHETMPEGTSWIPIVIPAEGGLPRIVLIDPKLIATSQRIDDIIEAVNVARQGLVDQLSAAGLARDQLQEDEIQSLITKVAEIALTPGPQGQPGKDGLNGKDGAPGLPGKDGQPGLQGLPGKDGAKGADGSNGLPGTNGKDGINGTNGTNGTNGLISIYEGVISAAGVLSNPAIVGNKVSLLAEVITDANGLWSIDYTTMGFLEVPKVIAVSMNSLSTANTVANATNTCVATRTTTKATGIVTKPVTLLALGITQVAASNVTVQLEIIGRK